VLVDGLVQGVPVEGLPPDLPIVVHLNVQVDRGGAFLECDILLEVPLVNDLNHVCDPVGLIDIKTILADEFRHVATGVCDLDVRVWVHHSLILLYLLVSMSCRPVKLGVVELPFAASKQLTVLPESAYECEIVIVDIGRIVSLINVDPELRSYVCAGELPRRLSRIEARCNFNLHVA